MSAKYDTGQTDLLGRPILHHRTTPARERVLAFIRAYNAEHGYAPTVREIGRGVGLRSPGTIHGILARLEREGQIERPKLSSQARARAIRLAAD